MHVLALHAGAITEIPWEGRRVATGFRKQAVEGRVAFRGTSLAGDHQADESVHGGPRKSVYVYPSEHYAFWRESLEIPSLPFGSFGENLTTVGWLETEARAGDVVRIGTAELEVTQPRGPCYKMNAAFARPDMVDRFHRAVRPGFYLGARRNGEFGRGDEITLVARVVGAPSIAELLARARGPDDVAQGGEPGASP